MVESISFLNTQFKGSPVNALKTIYPEYSWTHAKFSPSIGEAHTQHHKAFFDTLKIELGIEDDEESWYKVKREDIYSRGGGQILKYFYNNSLYEVMSS